MAGGGRETAGGMVLVPRDKRYGGRGSAFMAWS